VLCVVVWPCWWWWCRRWCCSALSSSSYGPGAPAIHPTSSGSSVWLRVLCRPLFVRRQVLVPPASFHPSSTPRAVAHGAGGGWCLALSLGGPLWGPGAVPRRRRCLPSFTHPTQPASRCLQRWEWVVGRRCHGILFGGGLSASVTCRAYGGCGVLTGQVSPFWGLPASLCALLTRVDSLTSRGTGRRGLGGHARFAVVPIPTPRAVAHGGGSGSGGGGCVGRCRGFEAAASL